MKIFIDGIIRDATPEEEAEILAAQQAAQPKLTSQDVNRERDRRISQGTTVDVTNYGPIPLQGRDQDQTNLLGLMNAAQLRIMNGDTTTLTKFRDADNIDHMLTPNQIIELWSKGAAWISAIYDISWNIKEMNPIPNDFREDSYWSINE